MTTRNLKYFRKEMETTQDNISVVKEGTLKFFKASEEKYARMGSGSWVEVNAKLLSNAVLEYGDQKIEIPPFVTVTPSTKRINFKGAFIINTKEETSDSSGPMFAGNGEEGVQWMRLINYVREQNNVKAIHSHPLTLMTAIPPQRSTKSVGPSVIIITNKDNKNCSCCKRQINPKEGYCCEFCNVPTKQEHYHQCADCSKFFKTFESPFINSPNHIHQLMKIPPKTDWRWSYADRPFECSKCTKKIIKGDTGYHCVECDQWTECGNCITNDTSAVRIPATIQLDVNWLKPIMKIEGNKYSLPNIKAYRCPLAASVITNKHWDLSKIDERPAKRAYFEVTFDKINKDGVVGVGIGNQIFTQNQLLGYQQNSFGYLSNGDAYQNIGTNHQHFESFTSGDTVGCGILLDSYNRRYVFYTKNGQLVGVFKGTLHQGMDCYPGVSFTRAAAPEFVMNLKSPFKFDLSSIPDYRHDQQNRLEALPTEILSLCFSLSVKSALNAVHLTYISKKSRDAANSNQVWKDLFLQQWPLQNSKLKIKSWHAMYKRRAQVDRPGAKLPKLAPKKNFIENCEMEFECPLIYEKLSESKEPGTKHCYKCQKSVYEVSDLDQLREFSEMGRCVTFIEKVKPVPVAGPRPVRMMGSVRAPAPKVPPPKF